MQIEIIIDRMAGTVLTRFSLPGIEEADNEYAVQTAEALRERGMEQVSNNALVTAQLVNAKCATLELVNHLGSTHHGLLFSFTEGNNRVLEENCSFDGVIPSLLAELLLVGIERGFKVAVEKLARPYTRCVLWSEAAKRRRAS